MREQMPTVLVTGCSTGIGLATATVLAGRGWHVFATMRNLEKSRPLEQLASRAGVLDRVEIEQLDVTDTSSIHAAVATILSRTSYSLDAIVHNAGVAVGGALEDVPEVEVRRVMETNFFGVLELTRAVLPTFRKQRRGRIVVVSSEAAFAGQPANSIYSASKWAVEGWAEALAYELEPFNIHVVLIEPGPYRTPMWQTSPRILPPDSPYSAWVQHVFRAADAHSARAARDPEEVARVIADALKAPRPRFRYPVGPLGHLNHFLRGKAPNRMLRRGVAWYLGLPRTKKRYPSLD